MDTRQRPAEARAIALWMRGCGLYACPPTVELGFGSRAVRVVIVREPGDDEGYRIALVSTDAEATAAEIVARYDDRWPIETCFQDAKHVVGVGEARNRVRAAVERTVPFGFLCQTIAIAWYALNGDPAADVAERRIAAPWHRQKRDPSMIDMLAALRREMIQAEFLAEAGSGRSPREFESATAPRMRAVA